MSPLDRLAQALEGRIGRQLFDAIRLIQLGVNLRLIERLIVQRQLEEIVRSIGWEHLQNVLAQAQQELVLAQEAGWREAIAVLPKPMTLNVRVDLSLAAHAQTNPASVQALQRLNLARIQGITTESQEAVRRVLEDGLRRGLNPAEVARNLRDIVGLTQRQTATLGKFRDRLVAENRKPDQIERMVARKRVSLLKDRSETIARTEVLTAIEQGKRAQWQRLVDEGTLKAEEWEVEWVTADDERTCPICEPLNGARTSLGGVFQTLVGFLAGPPAHPRCRCVARLVPKGFRQGQHPAPARRAILDAVPAA